MFLFEYIDGEVYYINMKPMSYEKLIYSVVLRNCIVQKNIDIYHLRYSAISNII